MTIRPIKTTDFLQIEKMLAHTQADWTAQTIKACAGENYFQWVVLENKVVVGLVVVKNNHTHWEILQIIVDQDYQHRGFGKQLLCFVIQEAKKNSIQLIQLEVRQSNHIAIALYEKNGFTRVGFRKKYYADGEDAVLMDRTVILALQ